MKITYEQLYRSYPVLNHLMNENLPINTTRRLAGLIASVNPHLEQIEATQNELLEKYSEETEDGVFEIVPEKRQQFIKELEKYLQYDIIITWEPLEISALGEMVSVSVKGLETISYLLKNYEDVAVIVEQVNAMPGQGVTSMFNFGQTFGAIKGVCAALGLPIFFVRPSKWKKHFELINSSKDASRTKAIEMYPNLSHKLARKKDVNKSDAILIARYHNDTIFNEKP